MKRFVVLGATLLTLVTLAVSFSTAATSGKKRRRAKPHEYGNVVINNLSKEEGIAPVVFRHWIHRSKYTCRLCHVDIGFAMKAGESGITEEDNLNGMFCGSCHDGTEAFGPEDRQLGGETVKNCDRCHSLGKKVALKNNFYEFRKSVPRERFGNGVDWMKAEETSVVKLKDYLEGISIKRPKLKDPEEMEIQAQMEGMPAIVFSHEKHAVWSGCELCHPDIFGVKQGGTVYGMQDIFNGQYCGACHGLVAFPNNDCQRCHTEPVF